MLVLFLFERFFKYMCQWEIRVGENGEAMAVDNERQSFE